MAILPDIPGLKVEVKVNREPLEEFRNEDEPDTSNTVTRYVEATSGANFTVQITYDEALDPKYKDWDISSALFLDGQRADKCTTRREKWRHDGQTTVTFTGVRGFENGEYCLRKMAFSQVNIVNRTWDLAVDDNDQIPSSTEQVEAFRSLGEIEVTFRRSKVLPESYPSSKRMSNYQNFNIMDSIPEKKLKGRAISHQVDLGEAQPLEYHGTSWSTSTKIDDKPFATFVFRYRSRNALKAECIISRTVSPEPLEDRPVEALTADEARELVRRLRDRRRSSQTLQPEVKQEVKQESDQNKRLSDVNIIDLGSDDSEIEITDVRPKKRQRTSGPPEVIDLSSD
ncbi:hypothetical protein DIS24_g6713 [Lasiodiplodia hormozganensis]|uniref:DUF7918 domain-containing protein n=1 Tax=Lasiodiplodia hormozganensis TaxID=869390 RepID=A0AA40CTY2_9PEZI|nr:hypothetical protein DIS24_g6713 [Lasiodiplodia hormozganensis]